MDPGSIGVLIPIVAIVVGVGSGMFKMWTKHQQEMAHIRVTRQVTLDEGTRSEFEALRQEVMQLRDTTTQYDMSVERALEEIRRRLDSVEGKTAALPQSSYSPPRAPEQQEQTVALGG